MIEGFLEPSHSATGSIVLPVLPGDRLESEHVQHFAGTRPLVLMLAPFMIALMLPQQRAWQLPRLPIGRDASAMTVSIFAAFCAPCSRRQVFGLGAAMALASQNVRRAAAAEQPLPLPPAAMVLQVAETTAAMQTILVQSARDVESLTEQQRKEAGRWPPITRNELKQSVDVLLRSSKLATFGDAGAEAAGILNGVKLTAGAGSGVITSDEYLIMARQYEQARDALKTVFESFSEVQQAEGREAVRKLQAAYAERVRQLEEEDEKLRTIRARIAAEKAAMAEGTAAGEPPRTKKKTLEELEEANAAFAKQQSSTVSLYAF